MRTHAISRATYLAVFAALLFLTGATVLAAFMDLGSLSTALALGIASLKSALVLLYFMHLRMSRLHGIVTVAALLWLTFLLALTLSDVLTRGAG